MIEPLQSADARPVSLRERKKVKTRLAIQEHALRLFQEHGYARTTVEQIAEAAEVSPSTFFRYFPTKEDVVLFDALDPLLFASFRRQPPGLTPIQALRGSLHEVFGAMTPAEVEEQRERGRLVFEIPELQDAMIADLVRTAGMMATVVAERSGLDPEDRRVQVYAGAVMGALMGGMIPILQAPGADFIAEMDAALDFLEGGLRL